MARRRSRHRRRSWLGDLADVIADLIASLFTR